VLFATMSPTIAEQFNRIIDLAVVLAVIPYVYAAVAVVPMVRKHGQPRKTVLAFQAIAVVAVGYCMWAVLGGNPETVVGALIALLLSAPLYLFFIRSMEEARRKKAAMQTTAPEAHAGEAG
jgi:arginine:agmatine antiporter